MTYKQAIRARHVEAGSITDDRSSLYPTETLPDEGITIPDLMARYVKGQPMPEMRQAIDLQTSNFDQPDWEKARHMDLVDHDELREELEEIEEARKEQAKKRKEKKEQKQDNSSPNAPPQAGTAAVRAERHAGDGAAAPAEK